MKITVIKNRNETEVQIHTSCPNSIATKQLSKHIQKFFYAVKVRNQNKESLINIDSIQYIEWLDRQLLIYTNNTIYTKKDILQNIEMKLFHYSFVRISKNTIVNIHAIVHVTPYPNHRLLLTLSNDEQLIVNRFYIPILKNKIKEEII